MIVQLINTLIRRKELAIAQRRQQLGDLRRLREQDVATLQRSQAAANDVRVLLWNQLQADHELQLQQLLVLRASDDRARQNVLDAEADLRQRDAEIAGLERSISLAQKELDKLGELRDERIHEKKADAQKREWTQLDEWVAARTGKH